MYGWWRHISWPGLAVLGWSLAGVFAVLAGIQRAELDKQHLLVQWGNAAEWVGGLGTVAAFFAASWAAVYAAREWRAAQLERHDRAAEQARLVIVEPAAGASLESLARHEEMEAVVRNHSGGPVFDLVISDGGDTSVTVGSKTVTPIIKVQPVVAKDRTHNVPTEMLYQEGLRRAVLGPGESSSTLRVTRHAVGTGQPVRWVRFDFTDDHGRRWRRMGGEQPERLLAPQR
jgi:hypothetical protein